MILFGQRISRYNARVLTIGAAPGGPPPSCISKQFYIVKNKIIKKKSSSKLPENYDFPPPLTMSLELPYDQGLHKQT